MKSSNSLPTGYERLIGIPIDSGPAAGADTGRERWTFFEDEGARELFRIKKGVCREA